MSWMPIETAPKDGRRLLLWDAKERKAVIGRWTEENIDLSGEITHWQPLPEPPAS